jgi:uncharacterized protein YgiM (DUF1202 family)
MIKKTISLIIAIGAICVVFCSCASSSGDSLLEVIAGLQSSDISSAASSDISSAPSSEVSSDVSSTPTSSAVVSTDNSPDIIYPENNYSSAKKGYVATQETPLTMRTGPSSSYDIITTIPKGADISVKGETGSYYYVEYNGKSGWVNGDYVKFSDSSDSN